MTEQADSKKPFGDVVAVASWYFHPESMDERGLDDLRAFARLDPLPGWLRDFRTQASTALEQHLEGMDVDEFERKVQPSARSDEIFLRRMWAIIFPDDPIPGAPAEPFDAIYTIIDIYFRERNPDDNHVHPRHLIQMLRLPEAEQTPLLRAIKPDLTRMLHGDFDGLDMREFRSLTSQYYFHLRQDDKDFARHVWSYLYPDEPMPVV